ncbi:hypothetical protein SRHO_G00207210 [Serrasalmus rhombeus]
MTLKVEEVIAILQQVNPYKANGPDGLKGRVLKECAIQLGPVLTRLFQMLLDTSFLPQAWKMAIIIPVPKIAHIKCMERLVSRQLISQTAKHMDPMQFVYRAGRGVEDATLILLDKVFGHLDKANKYVQYADDMALVACLQDVTSPSYSQGINHLVSWFDGSFLDLNVSKTKELCFGGRVAAGSIGSVFKPITIKGQEVEQVEHTWEQLSTTDSLFRIM